MDISIIIPVYNSSAGLEELQRRISSALTGGGQELDYEVILIDDHSKDNSYEVMKELHRRDKRFKIMRLMRNFGQHNAIMCGLNHASGKYIITMDDDLQNPPEEIPRLLAEIKKGYDCIIGRPLEKKHAKYRNLGSYAIGKCFEIIFGKPADLKMSSFRILNRPLVDAIIASKGPNPMIDALILSSTTNIINIDVQHDIRKYGASNYSLKKSYKLALNLLVNYSTIPLQFISINGFIFAIVGLLIAIYVVCGKIFGWINEVGWASIIALISVFSGLILISFGVVGEYLIRIIGQVSHFRQYAVRESSFHDDGHNKEA
ncbi:glycosyltransferase family 2 protein [Paenibacillus oenotherae]|uniref:Glycosyltransferase family 2 protein n=1 Tax=Paenibacillus oenotherae TaxID=1435645 RepID=A0ABS7D5D0_9BACL|nr:glycosyltransferase family 2 protein [Paenibacillus oenotherae]MBW7475059.1 glycosyltransferase family 2 protein [Paenibacillus oenotherae]